MNSANTMCVKGITAFLWELSVIYLVVGSIVEREPTSGDVNLWYLKMSILSQVIYINDPVDSTLEHSNYAEMKSWWNGKIIFISLRLFSSYLL